MKFFTSIFQGFYLIFKKYLNEPLGVSISLHFNREASQWSTNFLGIYYFLEHLNVKIPHSKLYQGKCWFPAGSTYLLLNMYWWNSYFPVNNYLIVEFCGEYLLTATVKQKKYFKVDQTAKQLKLGVPIGRKSFWSILFMKSHREGKIPRNLLINVAIC